jgi:hypothetical protein
MAHSIPTHYDNLKVQRNATVGVIKASYRALAQKYHPDRNAAPDALSTMMLINQAWDVLSHPERRARHDAWIASQEQQRRPASAVPCTPPATKADEPAPLPPGQFGLYLCGAVAAALTLVFAVVFLTSLLPAGDAAPEPEAVPLVEPPVARTAHGEMAGEPFDIGAGPATFELDNSAGSVDVHVKMLRGDFVTRNVYVHAGKRYRIENMKLGKYTVKYRSVVDGKARAYQARDTFALLQTSAEAREGRYNKYNKIRVTRFDVGAAKPAADAIALEQF